MMTAWETAKVGSNTKNVSIRDVAKHANVSVATITRVVNNSGYVSEKTRRIVQSAINELGYIPNRMASALKSKSTGMIGTINPAMDINPYFGKLSAALDQAASQYGFRILSMVNSGDQSDEVALLNELVGRMVDGIFFIGDTSAPKEMIQRIMGKGIPVVMLERPLDIANVDKVIINAWDGSAAAAEQLLLRGHTRVAYIGVRLRHAVETDRYEGFRQTLEGRGVRLDEANTVFVDEYTISHGYQAMRLLLDRSERPTAVFLGSDILASGALQCLYDARLRVPDDISLIGYDDTLAAMSAPPLSSVALPIHEMAQTAVALFLERRREGRKVGKVVQIGPYYVDRNTVKDLR